MNLEEVMGMGALEQQKMAREWALQKSVESQGHGGVFPPGKSPYSPRSLFWGENDPRNRSVLDSKFIPMKGASAKYENVGMDLAMPLATVWQKIKSTNPYLKGVASGDEMIATHNLSEANLLEAHELGGLPVPSIGISKVKYPMDQFGDIALIPDQQMVTPSGRSNPVYSTDAYSKRFPEVDYTVDPPRIFKGFTHGGKRRYSDYTLDNLVKMMKGDPRNAEDYFYGAGSLRAEHTPPFKNFKAMQKSRGKLISNKEMAQVKRRMSDEFEEIVDVLGPYDKHPSSYNSMGYMDVVGARLGRNERLSDYYDDLPRDVLDKISKFKRNLIDAPTEYFEAKPQRAVRLGEFKGAVVPEGVTDRTMEILKRFHKIDRIEKYGGNKQTKEQALKSFRDLMFSIGGGGFIANEVLGEPR
jgi:hypothetical protein